MKQATLNGISGTGEINFDTEGGTTIHLGAFRPDQPGSLDGLDPTQAYEFKGQINGEHGTTKVHVMGFDPSNQSYRIGPAQEPES